MNVAGTGLSGIEAGVLSAGNDTDLSVTVADLVRDGNGQLETSRFMINGSS